MNVGTLSSWQTVRGIFGIEGWERQKQEKDQRYRQTSISCPLFFSEAMIEPKDRQKGSQWRKEGRRKKEEEDQEEQKSRRMRRDGQ